MLYRNHLVSALESRREEFADFERALRDDVEELASRLAALGASSAAEIQARAGAHATPVTYPSVELDARRSVVVPFDVAWRTHEEARRWARETLENRVTFAADGSQLYPGREVSLPVGAVQVASFENGHTADGAYTKEAQLEVVPPSELMRTGREYESPEQIVSLKRFELEAETTCRFLERKKNWRARHERMPLAFLDGTLLISSARQHTESRFFEEYARALVKLVNLSRETEVPVVGYIDQSLAPDLRGLLETLHRGLRRTNINDAQMLRAQTSADVSPLLKEWGDRTIFWHCRRANLAEKFYDDEGRPLVGFVYLQTTADNFPTRLDIPAWVHEAGLLDEVADTVRAECVVGNGYPYAIETADEAAVMTSHDRAQFLQIVQEFAVNHRLAFRVSRKAVSKGRRR